MNERRRAGKGVLFAGAEQYIHGYSDAPFLEQAATRGQSAAGSPHPDGAARWRVGALVAAARAAAACLSQPVERVGPSVAALLLPKCPNARVRRSVGWHRRDSRGHASGRPLAQWAVRFDAHHRRRLRHGHDSLTPRRDACAAKRQPSWLRGPLGGQAPDAARER